MKYSQFIFQIVKIAAGYGDSNMSYESFLLGNFEKDEDYAKFLDKAFFQANSFFRRIVSLGKMPYKLTQYEDFPQDMIFDLPTECLEPISVFQKNANGHYDVLPFRRFPNGKLAVEGKANKSKPLYLQYSFILPYFRKSDIKFIDSAVDSYGNEMYFVGGNSFSSFENAFNYAERNQIDLTSSYNIPEEALMIGVDWCAGRISEDASKGHSQEIEAETRLNDLLDEPFMVRQQSGGKTVI